MRKLIWISTVLGSLLRTLSLLGSSLYTNRIFVRWYQQVSCLFHLSDSINKKNSSIKKVLFCLRMTCLPYSTNNHLNCASLDSLKDSLYNFHISSSHSQKSAQQKARWWQNKRHKVVLEAGCLTAKHIGHNTGRWYQTVGGVAGHRNWLLRVAGVSHFGAVRQRQFDLWIGQRILYSDKLSRDEWTRGKVSYFCSSISGTFN